MVQSLSLESVSQSCASCVIPIDVVLPYRPADLEL